MADDDACTGPNEISIRDPGAVSTILGVPGVPKSTCESSIVPVSAKSTHAV